MLSLSKMILPVVIAAAMVGAAQAQTAAVKLFKVVTVKDEIIIGVQDGEIVPAGSLDAEHIAAALKEKGELGVWQYAVRKGADGSLQQAPLHKIGLLFNNSLRVEPYATPLAILPPK
ncbi:hypothetical protein [Terrarubrum flagellatum]|uniref:hypothetical protein n=1 Tax=Terrirubrum flagellatum TaxID=2895980 RepID=UPI003144E0BB